MMDKATLTTDKDGHISAISVENGTFSPFAGLRRWWRGETEPLPVFEMDHDYTVHVADISNSKVTINELRETPRRLISSIEAKAGVFVPFTTDGHTFFIDDGKGPTIELGTAGASVIKLPGGMVMKYGKNTVGDIHFDYAFTFHNDVLLSVQTSVERPTFAGKLTPRNSSPDALPGETEGQTIERLLNAAKDKGVINPKEAAGAKKPAIFSVFPRWVGHAVGRVMSVGAAKYGRFNYRESAIAASTYEDAIERHAALWFDGEDNDSETGVSHLASVIASCVLLMDAQRNGKLVDDRQKTGIVRKQLDELEALLVSLPLPARKA